MTTAFRRLRAFAAVLALATAPTAAHEFWIEPPPGDGVGDGGHTPLALYVGDGFPGDRYARNPAHLVRLDLITPDGRVLPAPGRPGDDPAATVAVDRDGTHVAVYRSNPSTLRMSGRSFQRYLRDEGLEHVADAREADGTARDSVSEAYSRCATTIWSVGGAGGDAVLQPVGLRFELVPERDPATLAPGERLPVRVLLDGRPAPSVQLLAFRRGAEDAVDRVRTDDRGRATVGLDAPGTWLVSGVHIEPGTRTDWASTWTSLTFRIAEKP